MHLLMCHYHQDATRFSEQACLSLIRIARDVQGRVVVLALHSLCLSAQRSVFLCCYLCGLLKRYYSKKKAFTKASVKRQDESGRKEIEKDMRKIKDLCSV